MDDLVKQLLRATVSVDGDFDVGCNIRDAAVERLERAEAALAQSRAETAAAYERAAELVRSTAYTSNGDGRSLEPVSAGLVGMDMHHATIAAAISALATADQSAALDAVRAEAREQGMREAAVICRNVGFKDHPDSVAYDAEFQILAAIKGAKS
jgi:multidrug efflux pump subunit AcrA (membrane-fusion protein)